MAPIGSNLSLCTAVKEGIVEAAQSFTNNWQEFQRRNAVRFKVTDLLILGHRFESTILTEFTKCYKCRNLLWGLVGHQCQLCKLAIHKKCLNQVGTPCRVAKQDNSTLKIGKSHKFQSKYFCALTYCHHCGTILKGAFRDQGMECNPKAGGCGMSIHFECQKLVYKYCRCETEEDQSANKKVPCDKLIDYSDPPQDEVFYHESNKLTIRNFELIRLLGVGSFGKVYLAQHRLTGQKFAIKVMKKTNPVIRSDPECTLAEMRVLVLGRHYSFLTKAHCCFQSKDRLFFVMEYVAGQDLLYHIRKERKFTEERTRFYASEIVLAISFLHKKGIVYRDLKLDNVILDKEGHCKLLDFGMTKELHNIADMKTRTFCGTPGYISPEVIKELDYDFSVDWWALGVLVFEMLVGYSPFYSDDDEQSYRLIVQEEVKLPRHLSSEAKSLLSESGGLLTKDPTARLGCNGAMNLIFDHQFFNFNGYTWDDIEKKRVRPPYRPSKDELERSVDDESTALTPVDWDELEQVAQNEFSGFSYCSESMNTRLSLI